MRFIHVISRSYALIHRAQKIRVHWFTFEVDEYWIQGHTRAHKGHIVSTTQPRGGGGGYAEFASHTHDINDDYTDTETITDTWKKDDYVLMLPILGNDKKNASEYVVLGKLVRLDGN